MGHRGTVLGQYWDKLRDAVGHCGTLRDSYGTQKKQGQNRPASFHVLMRAENYRTSNHVRFYLPPIEPNPKTLSCSLRYCNYQW